MVIISDYRMPTMDGIQLLEKVKAINPVVTRILISAFEVDDNIFQNCHCIDKFLQKPISILNLIDQVKSIVNKSVIEKKTSISAL